MKCKLLSQVFAVLTGLFLVHAPCTAAETYGTASTHSFIGTVEVFSVNGVITNEGFRFFGTALGSTWTLTPAQVLSVTTTVDANLNLHSTVTALTYFTGGSYKSTPSATTVTVTLLGNGQETIGLQVYEYYSPNRLLLYHRHVSEQRHTRVAPGQRQQHHEYLAIGWQTGQIKKQVPAILNGNAGICSFGCHC